MQLRRGKNISDPLFIGRNLAQIINFNHKIHSNKQFCTFLLGFSGGSVVKNPPAHAGDARNAGLIPGSGRAPEQRNGNPLHSSCLENSMDRGTWWATAHGVTASWT